MTYEELKKQRIDSHKRLKDSKAKLESLEAEKESLMQSFQESYENLVSVRAKKSIGEGSAKDVNKADKQNKELKKQIEQIKVDIDVQKKAVSMLTDKYKNIDSEFKKQASSHFKDKSKPLFKSLTDALQQAEKTLNEINSMASNAQREGVRINTHGINHNSKPVISKKRISGMSMIDFITIEKLNTNNQTN